MNTYCFSHLLPKSAYPEYKLHEDNIALVCSIQEHDNLDTIMKGKYYIIKAMLDRGIKIDVLKVASLPEGMTLEEEILFCRQI